MWGGKSSIRQNCLEGEERVTPMYRIPPSIARAVFVSRWSSARFVLSVIERFTRGYGKEQRVLLGGTGQHMRALRSDAQGVAPSLQPQRKAGRCGV